MTRLSSEAQAQQARLQQKYFDSLPAKRASLAGDWERVQSSDWSDAALAALKAGVHRLAGSAGSYGFDQLGEAAAQLESSLRSGSGAAGFRELIGRQVRELQQALDDGESMACLPRTSKHR
ncbi:MAG: Hpt domain-containing protein [Xanthomonadales bacterium]|nr:Hpt domain-containing protein [Xanthomonadales bacterium]